VLVFGEINKVTNSEQSRGAWSAAEGEATDLIAFILALFFFCRFCPKNRMSSPKAT
jgi:hypothetical protein